MLELTVRGWCIFFLMLALTDAQAANVAPLYTEFLLFDLPSIG